MTADPVEPAGCWVVMSPEGPVTATVFADKADAFEHAFENHARSVQFLYWGETCR